MSTYHNYIISPEDFPDTKKRETISGFEYVLRKVPQSNHYAFKAVDSFHKLSCEMYIEVDFQEAICEFPDLNDDALADSVNYHDELLGTALVVYQMDIMSCLLSFCVNYKINQLIIDTSLEQANGLAVYEDIVEKTRNEGRNRVQLIIAVNPRIIQKWQQTVIDMKEDFYRILWATQKGDADIRRYLKNYSLNYGR